ncbi:sensor histidine kinase [Herbidospora galbida]|uniref:Sensor histidine kinase n=1 Tax=Herbidospora galbida TaxID=2575442 RepID=A0A4U3MF84_9ACTN|nr:sensor histidine kinase [Herbidospora galbida]TKK86557.1 sensor histidine kinase [Herbidospora galbida]
MEVSRRALTVARLASQVWLLVLVWPLWAAFRTRGPAELALIVILVGVFAFCWGRIMWRVMGVGGPDLRSVALLLTSAAALYPLLGAPWAYTSFVLVISVLGTLPPVFFATGLAGTMVVNVVALAAFGEGFVWWVPLVMALEAGAVGALVHMRRLIMRLSRATAESERLAVENERLRFARDLHDILGHTLTSITIRSQLAARLAETDPARAAEEMGGVERTARKALDDVRDAVAGYRAVSLPEELGNARAALDLAGIQLTVSGAGPVPSGSESLLAWVVREAVTNVLRHSGATRCWITLGARSLEIRDDGRAGTGAGPGTGLLGLAERVEAAGGTLEAGARPEGGYRLRVEVP